MGNKININMNGLFSLSYDAGVGLEELIHDYKKVTGKCVMGAKINNMYVDADAKIYDSVRIDFFDYTDKEGNKMYQSGLKLILLAAIKLLWNNDVVFKYSLDKGIYCEIDKKIGDEDIQELKNKMREIISYGYPIKRCITKREDAINYYLSRGELGKSDNIHNIPNRFVELYELNHLYNYFYSFMPMNTSELGLFDIKRVSNHGMVLMYPRLDYNCEIPEFDFNELVYDELLKYSKWSKRMNASYVNELNKIVSNGEIQKFIKMNNIYMNDLLSGIAKDIVKKKDVKMVLMGGPSSSGKTTSAHKLCAYLESFGLKPIIISADDYFKERIDTPKDENGEYDFESLKALDLTMFNDHLKRLLNGEEVVIPKFDFVLGKKEYSRDPVRMEDDNILVIEGIHCLNDDMTKSIKRENKYKVFICPLTPLGLDVHNHLSTNDMRLIRRIVRDNRTRGRDVEATIKNWDKVKWGEDHYIYPYTKDADAVLNTAYAYEMGVLRVFAEPLLYSVPMHSIYYEQARRLLGLLRMFYPISSEMLEDDNTLREFIGGSIYE